MNRLWLVAAIAFALPALGANDDPPGKQVDTLSFFNSIQGNYTIDLAGGQQPASSDNAGQVTADSDESVIQMPYCIPGGACYLGYNYFPTSETTVYDDAESGTDTHTILVKDGNTTKKYEWVTTSQKTLFRNYQFKEGSQVVTLEYQVTKD
jgi:hypothetical protein